MKLLIEEGDRETLGALEARPPRPGTEVLVLPPGGPKTKPRALNAGLLGARGQFLTVFDAEDRPDPDQLRVALDAFRCGPPELACVQARLAIDNVADGWLARHFAIEYAALFDVVLPALGTLGLPIALGGTSNHFRTAALRSVGGWDPGNVTEDADLGLRLARLGWATRTIDSTTWEEAPVRLWPWLRQRTRWIKGFMVTAVVHGRDLPGLARRLDPLSFAAAQLLIGGVAATALAYPVVLALILWRGLDGSLLAPAESLAGAAFAGLHVTNLIVGYSAGLACGWMGIDRRGPSGLARDLLTMPFYWLLVGVAAWRALYQIATARTTHWEKTTHGVSRRRAQPDQV
ncbi:glycosyltransferase family 2 protein [Hansschlegelia beijingensis]|uniref:glycosyltransferase family 2 protein n=1 Tax=Hansschlegelia beijingensis TaxID=1133344 RepID=UPI00387F0C4F